MTVRTAEEHLAHLEGEYVRLLQGEADPHELAAIRAIIDGYRSNGIRNPDRQTPQTVISRVLTSLGLTRSEFSVRWHTERRDGHLVRSGVRVLTWDVPVESTIARERERIEAMTWGMGHQFRVTVSETRSGQVLADVYHVIEEG